MRATIAPMAPEFSQDPSAFRVTFFFGPEPVDGDSDKQACVFNVKKRSWKGGIQVSVEIGVAQLEALRRKIRFDDRITETLAAHTEDERHPFHGREAELFSQAVSRCKLDLRLQTGLKQENQRLSAHELVSELDEAVMARTEYVVTYVLTELDLAPNGPSPSSY